MEKQKDRFLERLRAFRVELTDDDEEMFREPNSRPNTPDFGKVVSEDEKEAKEKGRRDVVYAQLSPLERKKEKKRKRKHIEKKVKKEVKEREAEAEFRKRFMIASSSSDSSDYEEADISEDEIVAAVKAETEESIEESPVKKRKRKPKKNQKFNVLATYQKPPPAWPTELSLLMKKEATFFQRKMRAFRNLKNHLLTANLLDIAEEAERKKWGPIPDYFIRDRPDHRRTHIEVVYHYWPQPFEDVEKEWLRKHMKEFKECWEVPSGELLESDKVTPYVKFVRCYPHRALLQVRDIVRPAHVPTRNELQIPMTGENLIIDAKAVITYYGMHRLKGWEVHDNIDYGILDFQVLIEEVLTASKRMLEQFKLMKTKVKLMKPEIKDEPGM